MYAGLRVPVEIYLVTTFEKTGSDLQKIWIQPPRTTGSDHKQGQTVHMLQLFWIYILLARLCIYIYINTYIHIYKYIYIYIYMFYSSIFWQHFHSGCYAWKSLIIWTFWKNLRQIFLQTLVEIIFRYHKFFFRVLGPPGAPYEQNEM